MVSMDREAAADTMLSVEDALDVTSREQPFPGVQPRETSVFKLADASPPTELITASPVSTCTGLSGFLSPNASQTELKSLFEDTCAQLEAARQQRTEVSSELFKCRRIVDELKEQQASLQTEMGRRLQAHRLDIDRLQDVQRELDSLRQAYGEKQSECIELAAKLQQVTARVIAEDQQQLLKEENQLLWQRIDELRQIASSSELTTSEVSAAGREMKSQLQKWHELHVGQPISASADAPLAEFVAETVRAIESALVTKLETAKAETLKYRRSWSQLRKKYEEASSGLARKEQECELRENQLCDQLKAAQVEVKELRKSAETNASSHPDSAKLKRLQTEIATLRSELRQNEATISESRIELSRCQEKLEEAQELLAKDREDFRERNDEWWSTEEKLQCQIRDLEKTNKTLQSQLSESKTSSQSLEQERDKFREEVESLRLEISELRVDLAEAEQSEHMQRLLGEEKQRTRCLEEQLAESTGNAEQLKEDLAASQSEVASLARQVEHLQAVELERDKLDCELQSAKSSIETLQVESGNVKEELARANSREEKLEADAARLESAVAVLERELAEAVNGPDLSTVLSEEQLESLAPAKQVQKLKSAVLKLVAEKRAKDRQVEAYLEDVAELRKAIEALHRQQELKENEWRQEYEGYVENLHRVEKQLQVANQERQNLESELQNTKSKLNSAEANVRRQVIKDVPSSDAISAASSGQFSKVLKERSLGDLQRALIKAEQKCAGLMSREKDLKTKTDLLQSQHRKLRLRSYGQVMMGMLCCWLAFLYGGLSC